MQYVSHAYNLIVSFNIVCVLTHTCVYKTSYCFVSEVICIMLFSLIKWILWHFHATLSIELHLPLALVCLKELPSWSSRWLGWGWVHFCKWSSFSGSIHEQSASSSLPASISAEHSPTSRLRKFPQCPEQSEFSAGFVQSYTPHNQHARWPMDWRYWATWIAIISLSHSFTHSLTIYSWMYVSIDHICLSIQVFNSVLNLCGL